MPIVKCVTHYKLVSIYKYTYLLSLNIPIWPYTFMEYYYRSENAFCKRFIIDKEYKYLPIRRVYVIFLRLDR